jgi:hypothetical protein
LASSKEFAGKAIFKAVHPAAKPKGSGSYDKVGPGTIRQQTMEEVMSVTILETYIENENIVVRFKYDGMVWDGVVDFSKSSTGDLDEAVNGGSEVLYIYRWSLEEKRVFAPVLEAAREYRARTSA